MSKEWTPEDVGLQFRRLQLNKKSWTLQITFETGFRPRPTRFLCSEVRTLPNPVPCLYLCTPLPSSNFFNSCSVVSCWS